MHVAIQDAMGWLDGHLHEFEIHDPKCNRVVRIGIPDEDECAFDEPILAGWYILISAYFSVQNPVAMYTCDFGDDRQHQIKLQKVLAAAPGVKYPVCIAGARNSPPEDLGRVFGYGKFLQAILNPKHKEHKSYWEWIGGAYDPEHFDPSEVRFDNPIRFIG